MKNILVPIDFSTASQSAGKFAAWLASVLKAKVTFVNVIIPAIVTNTEVAASLPILQSEQMEINEALMSKEIEKLSQKHAIKIEGFVAEGIPYDTIQAMAKEKHADIILMGMKGKGKSNSVFGSTTTAVIRRSSFPVLVIPENAVYQSIDKITFATDFDAETKSDRYSLLIEIAKKYDSFIQILNVQKDETMISKEEYVGKMKTDFVLANSRHSFNTIEDKSVIEGINKFIEEHPSDLLAMMAHKHSFFERMLGKIHTKEMSHETKIPLLVLQDK